MLHVCPDFLIGPSFQMNFKFALLLAVLLLCKSALAQTNISLGSPVSASAATGSGQFPANFTDGNTEL